MMKWIYGDKGESNVPGSFLPHGVIEIRLFNDDGYLYKREIVYSRKLPVEMELLHGLTLIGTEGDESPKLTYQQQQIFSHMQMIGSISQMEAFRKYGITKLSTRIGEMIRKGVNIKKTWKNYTTDDGRTVTYMSYSFADPESLT